MNAAKHQKKSVAVIGGGLAGLTGALYLARAGLAVHLFDKSTQAGGRSRSLEKSGMIFNLGAHALYAAGAGRRILDELRIPVRGKMPDITANEFIADGRRLPLPTSAKALLLHRDFSLREKWELVRVLAAIQKAKPTAGNDASGAGQSDRSVLSSQSLKTWLYAHCRSPRVRRFFEGMFRLVSYSADLDRLSAEIAIYQFQIGGAGVIYLDGGWQSLVDELTAANLAAGTSVHRGLGVAELERDVDGRLRVRPTAGKAAAGVPDFDYVLLACDPANAARIVGSAFTAGISTIEPATMRPVRAACLDVALSSLPQPSPLVLDFDRRLYFAIHSNTAKLSAAGAPSGAALIHTAKYLRQGESSDSARGELEDLLDRLQPGWRERVIEEQYLPRIVVVQDQPEAARGGLAGRVKTDCGAAAGVYVAGDWVGEEGFLSDAAFASAKRAAEQIIARSDAPGDVAVSPRLQNAAQAIAGAYERSVAG